MAFQSIDYLIFLPALLLLYWANGRVPQNVLVLLGSYFFYGYVHQWFLLLIVTSTVVDYLCALGMKRFPTRKRGLLFASLITNIGMLCIFKYLGFFVESVALALESLGLPPQRVTLDIVLPVGISFYPFQTMGYTIDVYRERLEARSSFLDYAVFVAFFPQLVAGPIERAARFLPQVEKRRCFSPRQAGDALLLLVWGFFKKLVIADNVALIADKIFLLGDPGFVLLWVGVLAFCVQIYADFSAYTDIARGTAKLFGFELMRNFEHPYISQTPAEFWRRWHISLSSWFRDYVYIPMGGRRVSASRGFRNVMVTFILSGLWHGASFNFALWGAYHGLLLVVYRGVNRFAPRLLSSKALLAPRLVLFFGLTNFGWLLFREHDLSQLWHYLTLSPAANTPKQWVAAGYFLGLVCTYSLPLVVHTWVDLLGAERIFRGEMRLAIAESAAAAILLVAMMILYSPTPSDFIYFRF